MKRKKRLKPVQVNIKRLREAAGLSQAALGRAIDRDRTWVWHWENGDFAPTLELLPRVAAALGCTIDDLITAQK